MAGTDHEVIIFAGPHGAGKDTVEHEFTASQTDATRHVRYSSRAMALGEVQGQTYHFVTPETFAAMVERGEFIDYADYPEGSSGIAIARLLDDVEHYRYTSITTNFEEGLTLVRKLGELQIHNRCLFIGPCTKETMLEEPERYLGALAVRMAQRARPSDDIGLRLHKAEIYRELYVLHQGAVEFIANVNGALDEAVEQVKTLLNG